MTSFTSVPTISGSIRSQVWRSIATAGENYPSIAGVRQKSSSRLVKVMTVYALELAQMELA